MADTIIQPCDVGFIRARQADQPCIASAKPWVLAATILGSSLVFINGSTVSVALPALQQSFAASVVDIQWIVNGYALFLAALILLGGALGDRFGRRRTFVLGTLIFAVASLWCGLAPNTVQLIAARAGQGVGAALLAPGSLAILSASFVNEERGQAIGLWSGISALAAALGPLAGGWLIDTFSWRWIFFILIPLALAVVVIALQHVPESRNSTTGGLDWWGALLVTAGLGSLTYGLIESSVRGFDALIVLATLVSGGLLLIVFVVRERRHPNPMLPLWLFQSRTFRGVNVFTLLLYAALGGVFFFLPLNLIQVQSYSATAAGAALVPMVLLLALLSRWAGGLVDQVGARLPLVVGPAITAAGYFLFTLPGVGGSYWSTFFPAMVVVGLGMAVNVAPQTTAVMNAVDERNTGIAAGINNAVSRLAGLLAVAGLGIVMVGIFSSKLQDGLAALDLTPEHRQAIKSQHTDLANISLPAELGRTQQSAVTEVIHGAFVAGFRVVMWIATGLTLLSSVAAWFMIEDEHEAEET